MKERDKIKVICEVLKKENRPLSRREISSKTKIEISSLCNPLLKLSNPKPPIKPTLKRPKYACSITGNYVYDYFFIAATDEKDNQQNG